MRTKYPRTPHLPWSEGVSSDDIRLLDTANFTDVEVVVTEKMDGENTTLYCDGSHARSIDSRYHPSRAVIKALQGKIGWQIPAGWRICGENLYARHSIGYDNLPDYFLVFSVWNEHNCCLSWDETQRFAASLGLTVVPELYRGRWNEALIRQLPLDTHTQEGYVVRRAAGFAFTDFANSVGKWVRKGHVNTEKHWMQAEMIVNGLGAQDED
ncbi:RNA ligase family protein [Shewanella sp.]|uniref:RNA ligase family protein n=1 Tax=Shewanella sp. TaxID=50422 RepID=UPI003A97D54C